MNVSPFCGPRGRRRCLRLTGVVVAAAAASIAQPAAAGYGPTPPPGAPVPGAFQHVVVTRTLEGTGGRLTAKVARGARAVVVVPSGAFNVPLQVTVTAPQLRPVTTALLGRFAAIAGIGVQANLLNGMPVRGRFGNRTLSVAIHSSRIAPGDRVLAWSAARHRFVPVHALVRKGVAIVKTNRHGEFIVVKPRPGKH